RSHWRQSPDRRLSRGCKAQTGGRHVGGEARTGGRCGEGGARTEGRCGEGEARTGGCHVGDKALCRLETRPRVLKPGAVRRLGLLWPRGSARKLGPLRSGGSSLCGSEAWPGEGAYGYSPRGGVWGCVCVCDVQRHDVRGTADGGGVIPGRGRSGKARARCRLQLEAAAALGPKT
ncbi:hypothetical protein chiPu_0020293, partial [Chiloscyllium punctatum]|nr:hypothetical protein [Chiloscyllium punctatum]